jgi:hypothetical protein
MVAGAETQEIYVVGLMFVNENQACCVDVDCLVGGVVL